MKIDIIRNNNDPYARYKMPKIEIQTEGKTTNIKTILINLNEVAASLKRPALIILKYIGYEKGTNIETKNNKYIVKGSYSTSEVQDLIYSFIEKYILCLDCGNPETYYELEKQNIVMICYACGGKNKIEKGRIYNLIEKDLEKKVGGDKNYACKFDLNEINSCDDITNYMNSNNFKKEEIIKVIIDSIENKEKLAVFKGFVDDVTIKTLLGSVELKGIEKNDINLIKEYVDCLIKYQVCEKSECQKYFQSKSKILKREDSSKVRNVMKPFFD